MESYFFAKSRLFTDYLPESSKARRFAVIHGADPRGRELIEKVRAVGLEAISYGVGREWDIHPAEFENDLNGLRGKIRIKDQELSISSALIGDANLENILGAVGVGFALRLPMDKIAAGVTRMDLIPGRLQKIKNNLGMTVVVDYAHTPDALEKALRALRPLIRGRIITLFGCGGDRDRGKRPLMGEIAAKLGDLLVLTSDNPRTEEPVGIIREIEAGVRRAGLEKISTSSLETQKGYWVEPDRRASIRSALRHARAGDLLLIAGKGHEDYQVLGDRRCHFDDREVVAEELAAVKV
jgi:UDP-N-acetylmuramoyl-L-alanyl-D-glutamate--2,6-diaminopimelate ligase